ncbi:hypothetical protein [Nonomuraea sp. C10]|uniref:hypothetical protein n=1 Tax=Nonomuraea sp. C10 TaxID=2600577 RepID=UPI0011CD5CA5|nr:hypothetical protein [Nonomuraea sp. C10]TXK39394.1 hypothetical protein FR742_07145 [Nonomuraea sp. C10]
MMIDYGRFKYALANLDGTQWRLFEKLSNVFISDEYPSLRPLASESGDEGMDAGLFFPSDDSQTALQFSVRKDWAAKVTQTCARLQITHPNTGVLIYASNHNIGPAGNDLKRKVRQKYGIFLDIRDREWFLVQRNASTKVIAEADSFCTLVGDPQLFSTHSIEHRAQALNDLETKAAFVYLGLQWEDDTREKGLTRLCFDALVRSVLRDTNADKRMHRDEIHQQIKKLLPAAHYPTLKGQVDGALGRLAKRYIRHWQKPDEFCLTWAERTRLASRLAEVAALDEALQDQLLQSLVTTVSEMEVELSTDKVQLIEFIRKVLEQVLLTRGEVFADAVAHDKGAFVRFEDVDAIVDRILITSRIPQNLQRSIVVAVIQDILGSKRDEVRKYLKGLADTYTLFAFMRETPDVQSAVVKIFSEGDIWLDTSVILPMFTETLLDDQLRAHTQLMRAAIECGLKLHVTSGVVEEIATHVQRCRSFRRLVEQGVAQGEMPYLLSSYQQAGYDPTNVETWLQTFAGNRSPEDDVAEFLEDTYKIDVVDLEEFASQASDLLRASVSEVWHEVREARDRRREQLGFLPVDPNTKAKLVNHDVENYVGIIVRREKRRERRSAFGYKSWWLTFDRTAFRMNDLLIPRMDDRVPPSPALSPDFMLHYLSVGPVRARLSKRTEESLPLMMNMSVLDAVPNELLVLADDLRKELSDLPPNVVNRKIRDTLEDARMLLGSMGEAGMSGLTADIRQRLFEQARHR